MAQLVLGYVGAVIGGIYGGPAGAQIGFALGAYLGGAISATSTHQDGPRLTDLKVTGTDYGSPIPWIKGAPRIACQFWWASTRREISTTTSQGGKGGPSSTSTTFTYEVDLLCGLTDSQISGVTRIWWNGKIVWTDLESADEQSRIDSRGTDQWRRITVYTGSRTQFPDPTYEAAVTNGPAYRGRSYVFLEGVKLGSSGQIPNLTFEVCSDLAPSASVVRRYLVTDTGYKFDTFSTPWIGAPAIVSMQPYVRVAIISTTDQSIYEFGIDGVFRGMSTRTGSRENFPGPLGSAGYYSFPIGIIDGQPVRMQNTGYGQEYATGNAAHRLLPVNALNHTGAEITSGNDLASVLPAGEYVSGVAMCSNGTHALILTSPTVLAPGGASSTKWYLVSRISGVTTLVRSGAVSSILLSAGKGINGNTTNGNWFGFGSAMLEDDLRHLWVAYSAGFSNIEMYHIDDDGVLRNKVQTSQDGTLIGFALSTIWAEGGYFVVFSHNHFGAYARSGSTITQVTLRTAVEALCARAGMLASQYDAAGLAGITKPVRALAIGQIGATRSTLEQMQAAYFFDASLSDKIYFRARAAAPVKTIPYADLAAGVGKAQDQPFELTIGSDLELAAQVAVQYSNISDDQRQGTEYSDRMIAGQASLNTVQIALGFTPVEAKGIADAIVADSLSSLTTTTIALPMAYADLEPADVVTVVDRDGSTYRLRINRKIDDGGVQRFDAAVDDAAVVVSARITSTAYAESASVRVAAGTVLYPLDIPLLRDADDGTGFYVAASGTTTNWPGCAALISANNVEFTVAAVVSGPAVMGSCTTILAAWPGGPVMDELTSVTVSVGDGQLASATRAAMLADDALNVMLIGAEIIRFTSATLVSPAPNIYKLTRLMRGQRGTEWAMAGHASNERAVLLSPQGLRRVAQQTTDINALRYIKGVTIGRAQSGVASQVFTNSGKSQRPFAPTDIRASRDAKDSVVITWQRRTRLKTSFCGTDGSVVPIGESVELYRVEILIGSYVARSFNCTTAVAIYTTANILIDYGFVPTELVIRVVQIGKSAVYGYPTVATVGVPVPISGVVTNPGAPLPPPPPPVTSTAIIARSNIVAETSSGVLVMRINENTNAPVYYAGSAGTMVATGIASTAFMVRGTNHTYFSFVEGLKFWYIASGGSWGGGFFASSVPTNFSTAPALYVGSIGPIDPVDGRVLVPTMIGSTGTTAICFADGSSRNLVFSTTAFPAWTYVGVAAPDVTETYDHAFSYFPILSVAQPRKLIKISSGWLIVGSNAIWRTADSSGLANWKRCNTISSLSNASSEASFFNAIVNGSRIYISGALLNDKNRPFLAISDDSGASWSKSNIGSDFWDYKYHFHHFMKIGTSTVAIRSDGKRVAINDGASLLWSESDTTGLGLVAPYNAFNPVGGYIMENGNAIGAAAILYSANGINWTAL